jgi:MFS family permease
LLEDTRGLFEAEHRRSLHDAARTIRTRGDRMAETAPITETPRAQGPTPAPVGRPGTTLTVLFLLYMLNYTDRQVMAGVAELMKKDLHLSDAQLGAAQTVFLVCVAGCAIPAAFLLDRWSRKKGVALMAVAWSLATALTGLAGGFVTLLAARALVGVGEAGFSSGGTAMLSAAYPAEKRAKILGIFNASIPLGAALGTVVGSAIAAKTGSWSTPFFLFGIPGLLLASSALLLGNEPPAPKAAQPPALATIAALLRLPTLRMTYVAFAMNVSITTAMLQWLPTYLSRTCGFEPALAGKYAGLCMVLALFGSPLGGFLGDFWAKRSPRGRVLSCAATSFASALVLAAALILGKSPAGLTCLVAWGILTTAYLAPGSAITQDVVHPSVRATAWGTGVLAMYLLGGAWSPFLVGAASDALTAATHDPPASLGHALLLVPVAGVLASVFFFLASRTYVADRAKAEAETASSRV